MANEGAEIDLYADDIEFNQDSEFNDQNVDLYDDVITPSNNQKASVNQSLVNVSGSNNGTGTGQVQSSEDDYTNNQSESNNSNSHLDMNSNSERDSTTTHSNNNNNPNTKKIGIYVGNLTWYGAKTEY